MASMPSSSPSKPVACQSCVIRPLQPYGQTCNSQCTPGPHPPAKTAEWEEVQQVRQSVRVAARGTSIHNQVVTRLPLLMFYTAPKVLAGTRLQSSQSAYGCSLLKLAVKLERPLTEAAVGAVFAKLFKHPPGILSPLFNICIGLVVPRTLDSDFEKPFVLKHFVHLGPFDLPAPFWRQVQHERRESLHAVYGSEDQMRTQSKASVYFTGFRASALVLRISACRVKDPSMPFY